MAFQLIPVLDLRGGLAVHARGGDRRDYAPVQGSLGDGGSPIDLAVRMAAVTGTAEVYLADLDAITGTGHNADVIAAIADRGLRPLVDLGLREGDEPLPVDPGRLSALIAATETLRGERALTRLVERFGGERVAFSLDLRGGRAILPEGTSWPVASPEELADRAVAAGTSRLILLDLSRVGSGRGPSRLDLVDRLKRTSPFLQILIGGGVSGLDDLRTLRDAGADGALIATALHLGRIRAEDLAAALGISR